MARATGLVQRVGHRLGGRRIVLPQFAAGLVHLLQQAVQQPGQFELAAGRAFRSATSCGVRSRSSRVKVRRPTSAVRRVTSS